MGKREKYIDWDEYFMGIAKFSEERSKDPNTQVGACIVNEAKHIIGIGYNGLPNGVNDDDITWAREGSELEVKYTYVCHAEANAINNCMSKPKGCKIYVTLFPCNECAKQIIQSGITEIIYYDDKYKDTENAKASKWMLDKAGVKYEQFEKRNKKIEIEL